jgi:hypothetical protein
MRKILQVLQLLIEIIMAENVRIKTFGKIQNVDVTMIHNFPVVKDFGLFNVCKLKVEVFVRIRML